MARIVIVAGVDGHCSHLAATLVSTVSHFFHAVGLRSQSIFRQDIPNIVFPAHPYTYGLGFTIGRKR